MSNNKPVQRHRVKWVNDFIRLHRLLGTDYTYFYDQKTRTYTVVWVKYDCTLTGFTERQALNHIKGERKWSRNSGLT